jgi:hypothetical protein
MTYYFHLPLIGQIKPEPLLLIIIAAVFLGVVGAQLAGHWVARRQRLRNPTAKVESSSIEAALFALLGLLVGFTFSGAETRLEHRRDLIIQEANAISTAYLRLDMLPTEAQPMLREEFRRYVDARLLYYKKLLSADAAAALRRAEELQRQIWQDTVMALGETDIQGATEVVVPALNEMFDITTARQAALHTHLPPAIFGMLVVLALACAYIAGRGMAKAPHPNHLYVLTFAAVLALTGYTILNLEYPRLGFVRLDRMDALLYQVRATMD